MSGAAATAAIEVDLPADRAWRALTAWSQQHRWMPLTTVDLVSGDGGLGTVLRARTGVGPAAVVDDMRIDVWEPPRRAEVAHLGRIVTGRGVFTVEPATGGRCRVTWSELPAADGLLARAGGLVGVPTRAALGLALRRFRRVAAQLA
jgi:uncharacterized protein YndB with AHSA1/START domain